MILLSLVGIAGTVACVQTVSGISAESPAPIPKPVAVDEGQVDGGQVNEGPGDGRQATENGEFSGDISQ